MKDLITQALVTAAIALGPGASMAQTWTTLQALPGADRDGAVCFTIGDKVYLGGGLGYKDFYEYDPGTHLWSTKPSIPGTTNERGFAAAFAVNGKGYVCLGNDGAAFKSDLWEYDPTLSIWTQRASYPSTARNTAFGFGLDGYGYVCGGADNNYIYSDFYKYDPVANSWTPIGALPSGPTAFGSTFVIGDYAYLMGGDHGDPENAEVYRYDPSNEGWEPMADFIGAPRQTAVAFALGGRGYFGCGQSNYTTPYADMFTYDPAQNEWAPAGTFNGGVRCWAVACNTADKAFMGTGWDFGNNFFNDWWQFTSAVGVEETLAREPAMDLFPVPAKDVLSIRLGSSSGSVVISDATGRKVLAASLLNGSAEVNVSELAAGTYQVMITERNGQQVRSSFIRS